MNSPNQEVENEILVTSCKDCVFAEYEGQTQTGCKVGKFDVFDRRGIEKIPAEDFIKEFFVIRGTCFHYRPPEWGDVYEGVEEETVKKEVLLKYSLGVIIDSDHPFSDLEKTIDSILKQDSIPKKIIIIINDPEKDSSEIITGYEKLLKEKNEEIETNVVTLTSDFYEVEHINIDSGIVDEIFSKFPNGYYMILKSGIELKPDSTKALSTAIAYHQYSIPIVTGFDGINGLTVQAMIHKFLGGSRHFDLNKKAKDFQEADNLDIMRNWDEVFKIYETGEL